ncbi:hypothetical protein DFJ74DRAFT_304527 [Hyaloraphidium curvatum]|nr:hypothetical protein DFJ74DRAFT_304527 [Hyaloraphidium curvatum]
MEAGDGNDPRPGRRSRDEFPCTLLEFVVCIGSSVPLDGGRPLHPRRAHPRFSEFHVPRSPACDVKPDQLYDSSNDVWARSCVGAGSALRRSRGSPAHKQTPPRQARPGRAKGTATATRGLHYFRGIERYGRRADGGRCVNDRPAAPGRSRFPGGKRNRGPGAKPPMETGTNRAKLLFMYPKRDSGKSVRGSCGDWRADPTLWERGQADDPQHLATAAALAGAGAQPLRSGGPRETSFRA